VQALDFLHSQGVVVHDLKPANVLLDASGNASLSDFGFVSGEPLRLLRDAGWGKTFNDGLTVVYAAPEMLSDGKAS
jgi:serine/threonine protein kinase